MIRAVYNNKAFKILNQYCYKFSNSEVTFNDITIDFTGHSIKDIPLKYQEIQIRESETEENILDGKILFTGYLDEVDLSEMKHLDEDREMTLTLLSPFKMATKRNVTLFGTYEIKEAVKRILQPLFDDGFTLAEINVEDGQITLNFLIKTVEECMNVLSSQRNIFWFINEKKEIFVNSLEYLFGQAPQKIIKEKENGLLLIQPKVSTGEYANVINLKNFRLIYQYSSISGTADYPILDTTKIIKNGDIVDFINPIVFDESYLKDYINHEGVPSGDLLNLYLEEEGNSDGFFCQIGIDSQGNTIKTDNFNFNDNGGEEKKIVFQRDSFFSNLITGFKWNGNTAKIAWIASDTALRYTTMRFMDSQEIEKCKNTISKSGQVEQTIDLQEKWFDLQGVVGYAKSLISQNNNKINQVTLEYDIDTELKIGDIVEINRPEFLVQGKFVVSDIDYSYNSELEQNWRYTLKNSVLFTTFIDLFRKEEKQENQDKANTIILSEFTEEKITESHVVEVV